MALEFAELTREIKIEFRSIVDFPVIHRSSLQPRDTEIIPPFERLACMF